MDWLPVLVNLIITGILLYVFQKVIDERAERRLEKFKAELRSSAFERETKFLKLHEDRVPILVETYNKMLQVKNKLNKMYVEIQEAQPIDEYQEILKDFNETLESFLLYFENKQIYLPDNLYRKLFEYYQHVFSASTKLSFVYFSYNLSKAVDENTNNLKLEVILNILNEKIPPLLIEIENEFRELISAG